MELIFWSYSSLNTARSALSTVILLPNGNTFGNNPLVTRLMRGGVRIKTNSAEILLSEQRRQIIHALRLSDIKETNGQICFDISTFLKTSKPGKH